MYKITNHNDEISYRCSESDTLLRSALRAGLNFPYECNSGGCGSCKFELITGELDVIWQGAPGRSPRDIRKGKYLGCQCRPRGDCKIKLHLTDEPTETEKPQKFEATFVGRHDLTSDMAEFVFESDSAGSFLPGQNVLMSLPGVTGERAYSMSNVPGDDGLWQFIVKKMPGGAGSTYLFDSLVIGDKISMDGPFGLAYLRPESSREIVLLAGGSGLSPIMSIARSIANDDRFNDRVVRIFYGGRGPADICTPALVKELGRTSTKFLLENAISDATLGENWQGECCFVHELAEKVLGNQIPVYEYYFCGPPSMTDAVQRMLMIDHQLPFDQLHFDRFF
ncbi:MAG TPA: 2Fe-2S iron-sulfur cluster binding domain-containing protein [Pseudomonadales bacterium]|nr:2Fe-2S iron-sulfur cluster binding domain-containing protein [Gammaproteobacteria bacterium]HIL84764.1 2Fe-2S iron-sulfur cluster binding domain-containing protein [Pseudomonadales bacterium]